MARHAFGGLRTAALTLAAAVATTALAANAPSPALIVTGEDHKEQRFDEAALSALPQHTVQAEAHGNRVECSGPDLIDVLTKVGVPTGEALRGKNLSLYVRGARRTAIAPCSRWPSSIAACASRSDRHGYVQRQAAGSQGRTVAARGAG